MIKVSIPESSKGPWDIKHIEVKDDFHNRKMGSRYCIPGKYTALYRNGKLIMSDTTAEMYDHRIPIWNAKGDCLINGLGIGMVLHNILQKPEVTNVTVIEISQDLIDLVGPHYANDSRVKIICSDAYVYMPPKGVKYDMVWHDIWDDICADNLEGMKKLHYKYGRRCTWQGSWARQLCEYQKNEYIRSNKWY